MNTSEQLKADAIRKAWIAEIGEEKYSFFDENIDEDGFGLYPNIQCHEVGYTDEKWESPNSLKIRPISLSGIENNNGWISLEADGSNLPESGEYWVVDTLNGIRSYLYHAKDGGDIIFWKNQVTHFQEITKPQPPIF